MSTVHALITEPFGRHTVPKYIFAAFAAIAWYNAIELVALCLVSFKRWRGCYFWSLLVASASIIPYTLGFVLLFYPTGASVYAFITPASLGWCGMVTGQSLVLWSRLHLVLQNRKLLWGVLWMILIDAALLHVPTIVLLYGALSTSSDDFADGYFVMEHIQLTWFYVQELIISSIYIWETVKLLLLRPESSRYNILRHLLIINIIILILGTAVVVIEHVGLYWLQVTFKPVAYSIKLKLEYAILGKMVILSYPSYGSEELSSSGRGIVSLPSSQEPPSHVEPRSSPREHSLAWFWENL